MNNRYREEENDVIEEKDVAEEKDVEVIEETEAKKKSQKKKHVEKKAIEEVESVNSIEEELVQAKEEVKRIQDLYLRTLAETENYKKRINDERIRERKYASQSLLEKLINTLDIFDKALSMETDDPKLKNFLIGFQMINTNVKQILEDEGVKKMSTIGQKFNPMFHHAVDTDINEEKDDEIILDETQSGFMYKDRVLRPAMVKVNKKNKNIEKKVEE